MGVRRAVELACSEAERSGKKVYTLGPLIHNPQALEDLKRRGVEILNEETLPEYLSGTVVIIRAHGISPFTEAELKKRGAQIVDATCPKVKTNQLKAESLTKAGYRLFIAGEETHAEIAGIIGYASGTEGTKLIIVNSADEAEKAAALHKSDSKTALIGQTTISADEYKAIVEKLIHHFPEIEIVQSICNAASKRQESLRELLEKVDAVIIAGGKNSSNTKRLLTAAQASGKPCILAEKPTDIPPDFFKYETIGLAAGASTPDTVIDEIEKLLEDSCNIA